MRRAFGFSLTEMLTALGLMVLLTGIATPVYMEYRHKAVIDKMTANASSAAKKISTCFKYAELSDCVDPNNDGNCDANERFQARWGACYAGGNAGLLKLGLIPCAGTGAVSVSSACETLEGDTTNNVLCVTLKWRKQQGCVRYDATSNEFTVCVDAEKPGNCLTTCDIKKGYKCNASFQCVCA